MFLANKLNKGAGTPAAPADAQFNYVTMLLHGDGTNGAQNNTFLDSSTNAFSITRNGNTTQGSFSPYGSNWSNNFNGSSSITAPDSSAFDYGSGDFTLECWIFPTTTNSSTLLTAQTSGGIYGPCNLFFNSGALELYSSSNGSSFDVASGASVGTPTVNQWSHVAVSRSGTSIRCFLNGTLTSTTTSSATLMNATGTFQIASRNGSEFYSGYVSNFRVVKGTAVYTSAFTPSTTPLTAISGTSLLTCADNRFIDDSTNNFAITVNGTPSVQRFNPFGASTAYDTSVIGGSGYFDGSGDLLTLADSSAWDYGSGDFTIEFWYYPVSNTTTDIEFIGQWTSGSTDESWSVGHHWTNGLVFFWSTDGSTDQTLSSATILTLNAWNHIAVSKSGTTVSLYLNGARLNTGTLTGSIYNSSRVLDVGGRSQSGANQIQGYLSDVRTVKGTAVYNPTSTTLTVPTAPLTAITNTALLMNFTNGAIFDNAMMNDLETVGNAQISTSVVKYGTGSLAFDGTGDYLVSAPSPNNILGGGDFTLEFWLYPSNTSSAYRALVSSETYNPGTTGGWSLYQNGTSFELWIVPSNIITATSAITASVWQHVALCRASGTLRLFVNGTSVGSVSNTTSLTGQKILIGDNLGSYFYNGYLDDLRITKGYARYTATFTPPTAALPDTGPV